MLSFRERENSRDSTEEPEYIKSNPEQKRAMLDV
jgi:hypothetical protein